MQFLVDIIPAKARRYVYGAAAVVLFGVTIWQTAGGDWKTALASLAGSALTTLAHANTTATPEDEQSSE